MRRRERPAATRSAHRGGGCAQPQAGPLARPIPRIGYGTLPNTTNSSGLAFGSPPLWFARCVPPDEAPGRVNSLPRSRPARPVSRHCRHSKRVLHSPRTRTDTGYGERGTASLGRHGQRESRGSSGLLAVFVNVPNYLTTWNCVHIANAIIAKAVATACWQRGLECPVICTPEELLGE